LWAAILLGKGVIEGLDQSGENSYWYGREKPPEMRAKISKTLKEKWKNGSFKNRLSEEGRKRISEAAKGRVWTEEQRKKASEAQMGEKNSQYGKPKFTCSQCSTNYFHFLLQYIVLSSYSL
jgi:hypothetical protein